MRRSLGWLSLRVSGCSEGENQHPQRSVLNIWQVSPRRAQLRGSAGALKKTTRSETAPAVGSVCDSSPPCEVAGL